MSHFKCGPSVHGWPLLTLVGIVGFVLVGIAHSAAIGMGETLRSYLACDDELAPRFSDGFGPDGYGS